jgi:hypothetical protein
VGTYSKDMYDLQATTLEVFDNSVPIVFSQKQCEQAKELYANITCQTRKNNKGQTYFFNRYENKMSADICKKICVTTNRFAYAAVF